MTELLVIGVAAALIATIVARRMGACRGRQHNGPVMVLVFFKGDEKYVFVYDAKHAGNVIHRLGCFAANPDLSFTWYDATVLARTVRELAEAEG